MMPKTGLPTIKKLMTAPTVPSKVKLSWTSGGDGQKLPSWNSGSSASLHSGGPGHPGRKRSRTQASQHHSTTSQEQRSRAKAFPVNKTPTLGKTHNPQKIPSPDKAPSPEETPTPDKPPTPEETPTLEDKASPPGVPPEDEAPGPKMALPGDEASALEKALAREQVLSEVASAGDTTQFHLFSPEAMQLPKGKSLLVREAQSAEEEVNMPEEPCLCMMKYPLDETDSSALQSEAKPESGPALEKAHPLEEATTLLEEPPVKEEATPQEVSPKDVEPAQKNRHPISPIPDTQETPTLSSLVPQNPTDSKSDRGDIVRLQDEVESLRRALELMAVQLERKLTDIWEELESERKKRQLLEVQMKQKNQESGTSRHAQTQTY
ncbi:SH3 domain containing 21 [Rhinolophus ferrumequinum]|nr:SH3 domain containing 21 [Rhinolophus ferrumequinum]